jgi:hypothetical protein
MKIPLNHKADRKLLVELCSHLNISERRIKRDELDYWNIIGRRGKIDTDSVFWYVRVECQSSLRWRRVKEALQFMDLWQDGDDEGALRLQRYPTEEEAQKIRKNVGLTGKRVLTEECKEMLRKRLCCLNY